MTISWDSWADEHEKLAAAPAEGSKPSRKRDMLRLLQALGVVGAGTLVGAGAGQLVSRGIRKQVLAGSTTSKVRLLRRAPYILAALGGLSSLAAHVRHQKLRGYVEHGE